MPFAGTTGTVIIEPGATGDSGPVSVTMASLTIKGDPNAPGSILPKYDLNINAGHISLNNLNLGTVTVAATAANTSVTRSWLDKFVETGATSGAGHNVLSQNMISGSVDLGGNSGLFQQTTDIVQHNTFHSTAQILLRLTNSNSTEVRDNTFIGDATSQVAIMVRSNSDNVIVANNNVELSGASNPIAVEIINTGGATGNIAGAKVLDNTLSTSGHGTGVFCDVFAGGIGFAAQIEGNDFHGNQVGVDVFGVPNSPTGAGKVDIGGGSNGLGSSQGGNNFRGFDGQNGHFAIVLRGTDAGVGVSAKNNIFNVGVTTGTVVKDGGNGAGTGAIDASSALNSDRSFVQNLYTRLLGRAGNPAAGSELDGWVSQLGSIGRSGVTHNILYSTESLNRVVDQFYLTYLGRASGPNEKAFWVTSIQNGQNIDQVEAGFLSSPEFLAHSNTDFVQALYIDVLGRTGGSSELASWYTVLPQLNLQGVAASFTGSQEHRTKTVTTTSEACCTGRPPVAKRRMWRPCQAISSPSRRSCWGATSFITRVDLAIGSVG